LLHAARGGGPLVRARGVGAHGPGRRGGWGQSGWRFAPGGRHPREPRHRGLGERWKVGGTLESPGSHQRGAAGGGWPLRHLGTPPRATVWGSTAIATARVPQPRAACGMRDEQCPHAVVAGRPMRPAVPPGEGYDRFRGGGMTVGAPSDMPARRVEMGQTGRTPQAGSRCRGTAAVECRPPRRREGSHSPAEGVIMARCGPNARRNPARGGRMVQEPGHQGEGGIDQAQASEPQRFDRLTRREVAHGRVVVGDWINDVAKAACGEHASDQAARVPHLTTGSGVVGQNHLLCTGGEEMFTDLQSNTKMTQIPERDAESRT
jgi:hypothetical protein